MWRSTVTSLYPEALTRTYCVPPVHFNRVPYVRDTVPGTGLSALVLSDPAGSSVHGVPPASQPSGSAAPVHSVPPVSQQSSPPPPYSLWTPESDPQATPARVQESDVRDDTAQRHILANLQALGNAGQEPMFILSQLNFGDYLNEPSYAAAVEASQLPKLPRPADLGKKHAAGDFDILLIHRRRGILVGELKSVGRNQPGVSRTPAQADDDVAKRVGKAVKQLDKSETVLRHLVSDIAPGLLVRKTIFLPYVGSEQLHRVLTTNPQLGKLSHPDHYQHVTPVILSQRLSTWWRQRMACTADTQHNDDTYLDIVARLVGPATTVRVQCSVRPRVRVAVRTEAEAVAELGWRLALLVLTVQQLDLMTGAPPHIFLAGPPGTGKTLLLVLVGLRWLRDGHDVHIVSAHMATMAASLLVRHQLQTTLRTQTAPGVTTGTVYVHCYDFINSEHDVTAAVNDLSEAAQGGQLHVLVDEANFGRGEPSGPRLQRLVRQLAERLGEGTLHLWAAGVAHDDVPAPIRTEFLTTPLRSAPVVLREVQRGLRRFSDVRGYSHSGLPAPGDGLSVVHLSHRGNAHTGRWPVDCLQCGKDVAAELRRLGVGLGGDETTKTSARDEATKSSAGDEATKSSAGDEATKSSAGDKATKSSAGDEATKTSAGDKTTKSSAGDEATKSSAGDEATKSSAGDEATKSSAGDEATKSSAGDEATKSSAGDEATKSSAGDETAKSSARDEATKSSAGDEATKSSAGDEATKSSAGDEATKSSAGDEATKSSAGDEATKSSAGDEATKSSAGDEATKTSVGDEATKSSARDDATSPAPLTYRDVFVLTRSSELQDDVKDDAGRVISPACGVVRGLRAAGVPVRVLGWRDRVRDRAGWERGVEDTAVGRTEGVLVTGYRAVGGLERRVVVWLPGRHQRFDAGDSDEEIEARDRLYAVSRCTSQLVVVDVPSGP